MSEERKKEETLRGLQDQVRELNTELSAAAAAANRSWKVTAWILAIVCAVIVIYLGVIYGKLKGYITPEGLVEMAMAPAREKLPDIQKALTQRLKDMAPQVMQALDEQIGDPNVRIPELRKTLAEQLTAMAPQLADSLEPQLVLLKEEMTARREELAETLKGEADNIAEQIRPQLEDLKNRIPELTQQYSKTLTDMAPAMADKFRDSAISYLPRLQDKLLKMTEEELAAKKPELTRMVDDAVQTLIDQHAQDIATLDSEQLAATLVPALEEAAGPVLDEFCAGIDLAIVSVRDSLSDLVQKYKAGTLTREEEIELRYIQLWKTYWNVRMEEKIESVPPLTL